MIPAAGGPRTPFASWTVLLLPVAGVVAVDFSPDFHAVKYAVLMAAAFASVAAAVLARARIGWSRACLALWVFVAVRGWMLWNSPMTGRSVRWWSLLLALVLAHHAACTAVPRRWLRRRAPVVLGCLGAVAGGYALAQLALPSVKQAHSFFANRNFAGAGLALLLPYALAVPGRGRWALAGLVAAGLLATTSRGGMLGAAAAGALLLARARPPWRWPVLVGAPAVVLAAGLLLGGSQTVKVRAVWYRAALEMGLDHPVAGLGADGFLRAYPPVRPAEEHRMSFGMKVDAVHNDYLESFAEGGVPGLAAHLLLVVAAGLAVRRSATASASLLAFAVISLVDQPMRDPSLLALALFGLSFASPRRTARVPSWPPGLVALLAVGSFFPLHFRHARAERALMDGRLDDALAMDPLHPEARILRSRPEDLEELLRQEPHHAGALLNRTRSLPPEEAVPALREIFQRHDPNDAGSRVRLAQLVMRDDALQAVSLLDEALRKDPRPWRAWLLMARLHREMRALEGAEKHLEEAEARAPDRPEVAAERLDLEMAVVAGSDRERAELRRGKLVRAVARLPRNDVVARVDRLLADAARIEEGRPAPRLEPREGETPGAFAKRIETAKGRWQREVDEATRHLYLPALVVADALCAVHPEVAHFRLLAAAARGLHYTDWARRADALALFVEALEAMLRNDDDAARRRLARALQAHPDLAAEAAVREAVKGIARMGGPAVDRARRLLDGQPALVELLR